MRDKRLFPQVMRPIPVPWQISPSTSFMELRAFELGQNQLSVLVFCVHFGPVSELHIPLLPPSAVSPAGLIQVQAEFELAYSAGLTGVLDPQVFPSAEFQSVTARPGESVLELVQRRQREWQSTGLCPDPGFYVGPSDPPPNWNQAAVPRDWFRYIVEGHDCFADILATGMRWRVLD